MKEVKAAGFGEGALHSMAGHYASADVGRLLKQANLLLNRSGTQTVLRVGDGRRQRAHTAGRVPQQETGGPGFAREVHESRRDGRDPVDNSFHNGPTAKRRTWFSLPSL